MISEEVKREEGDRDARASAEFSSSNIESFLVHSMPIIVYDEDGDEDEDEDDDEDEDEDEDEDVGENDVDFRLGDVWNSFAETSAFGCEVPLEFQGKVIAQYYSPFVSAFQIFENDEDEDDEVDKDNKKSATAQYFESVAPYSRAPMMDVIEKLTNENEKVSSLRVSEIDLNKSWISFAWYPIYRIPQGTSRTDIQGCFLTYHGFNHLNVRRRRRRRRRTTTSKNTTTTSKNSNEEENNIDIINNNNNNNNDNKTNTRQLQQKTPTSIPPPRPASLTLLGELRLLRRIEDCKKQRSDDKKPSRALALKPFGLCCYKTDPEIFFAAENENESERTAAMIDGAYAFLRGIKVIHPDYEFFSHHG